MTTTSTRVTRRIAADPTSTALLLAGPGALELWPGVRRVDTAGRRVRVEAELLGAPLSLQVRAHPPQRTPTSFLTRFDWTGSEVPDTTGELRLRAVPQPVLEAGAPRPASRRPAATIAELVLESVDLARSRFSASDLDAMALAFLDNLAAAAEQRNRAA